MNFNNNKTTRPPTISLFLLTTCSKNSLLLFSFKFLISVARFLNGLGLLFLDHCSLTIDYWISTFEFWLLAAKSRELKTCLFWDSNEKNMLEFLPSSYTDSEQKNDLPIVSRTFLLFTNLMQSKSDIQSIDFWPFTSNHWLFTFYQLHIRFDISPFIYLTRCCKYSLPSIC